MAHPSCASDAEGGATGPRPDSLARAGLSTFGASIFSVSIGFVSSIIVARALGPSAKGSYNIAVASAGLISMVFGSAGVAGITLAVARGDASPLPLLRVLAKFAVFQIPVAALLLWAISMSSVGMAVLPADRSPWMIGMMAGLVGATSALAIVRSLLIGLQQIVSASWRDIWGRTATASIIGIGLGLGILLGYRASPVLLLGLTTAGTLLAILVTMQALLKIHPPSMGSRGLREAIGYGTPLYAGNLVQFLNYRLDVFLVAALVGVRAVGIYALAVAIGQLLWILSSSVAVALLPRVASGSAARGAIDAARLTRLTLVFGLAAAVILALTASPLVQLVYGQAYAEAVPALLALLPGVVAFMAANVLAAYVVGLGRPRINLIASLVGLSATVSLDFILIPRLGVVGAAIASTISYTLSAIVIVRWATMLSGLRSREFLLIKRTDVMVVRDVIRRLGR